MTLIEKICEELGVEVGEEWVGVGVHANPPKYTIADNTLWVYNKYESQDSSKWEWIEASMADYVSLIKGELKPMWKPKQYEKYYMPNLYHFNDEEKYDSWYWEGYEQEEWLLENNMVFRTKEEAIEAANKMLNALKEED